MNNFNLITPEEYYKLDQQIPLEELKKMAKRKSKPCINCGEPEWKLGQCELCFSCTTGESDASEDYELI